MVSFATLRPLVFSAEVGIKPTRACPLSPQNKAPFYNQLHGDYLGAVYTIATMAINYYVNGR
ncbi:hypothetical protein [Desulfosediminicola flagellatus]|uniref:hypothetical protein n=1 Tax=Desulfosediminicola flagellatus TaxID=2569541 RepID=UPI0010AD865C|nr:hypothetical protein [Desulfosediminicola flagellatus]